MKTKKENTIIIEGKDLNLDFMIGGIYILPLLVVFTFNWNWVWLIITVGVVLLLLHWKTAKFIIEIDSNQINFWKKNFGVKFPTKSFSYDEIVIESGELLFKYKINNMKVHFERETLDTVEFELNSTFYPIGTTENAAEIMKKLRNLIISPTLHCVKNCFIFINEA